MTEAQSDDGSSSTIDALRQIVGADNVLTGDADRRFFSSDVYREAGPAAVVIQTHTREELAAAVGAATKAGLAVIPRGGGLSYTGGYLPNDSNAMIVDTRGLDRIVEINAQDMYVTVEAGCTWKSLYEALGTKNVRTPYFGPLSGMYATVGGALSQNSMFFGSGLYGAAADSVLGLQVVLADGSILKTGSAATPFQPSPFFRSYGPDLTGLFVGDTGALGFKVEATFKLIPAPAATSFASFGFDSMEDLCQVMAEVSRRGLAAECFGFDPFLQEQRMKRAGLIKDLKSLAGVARAGKSLGSGLKEAAKVVAAGRRFMEGVNYSMHVVLDGRNEADATSRLEEARSIALATGTEVKNSMPKVVRAAPFGPPVTMLGPEGQRWVPIHAIVPHSRIVDTINAVQDFFESQSALIDRHGIEWGYLLSTCGHQAFLVEPMFFWEDARNYYHDRYLGDDHVSKLKTYPDNPAAREAVHTLRSGLADLFKERGAVHFQIGKWYRYREGRHPKTFQLLEIIKDYLDPAGRVNPGSLGLG